MRRNRRLAVRRWYSARSAPNRRCTTPAISFCTWGTVNAGVHFFPPPGLLGQEPRRDQGQGLVVVPPPPGADLVAPHPRLPLGPLQALLDLPAMMPPKVEVGWPERPALGPR